MSVQLSITVANATQLLSQGYTLIEVWQSTDSGNTFQEITSSGAQAATTLSVAAQNTFQMGGKLLKVSKDGAPEVAISFSSIVANWTPIQVVNRINEVLPGFASVVGSQVKLTSGTTGRTSSITVTYDDSNLGFTVGKTVYGTAARIALGSGILSYTFTDMAGLKEHRYKWRFSANGSAPISPFSAVVSPETTTVVGSNLLSICSATFVDAHGKPSRTRVVVATVSNPSNIGGFAVTEELPVVFEADEFGYLQFSVMRGVRIRVAIEGTTFVREFDVPDNATFDLLQQMSTADDPFTVQSVPPSIIRRSV